MERDVGFRSWFQRAIHLSSSPQIAVGPEDSVDAEDHFTGIMNGIRAKTSVGRTGMADGINHWRLLLKDNVRFWDCLAMLRSDPALSCHSAIYLVTQSPDSEYFPEELRSVNANYFKDDEDLQTEILRLMVENRRLHVVLWVLSDNPHFRVDSVVAAIFRLNDVQFEEKFQFVYHPGCFSGKSPVLGPGTKGADTHNAGMALRTKRSRSSTPVRPCRPLCHGTDRLYHSVTRNNNYNRRGKNVSSNKSSPPSHKYEPPRKRRSDWMKSALITGLDSKSDNSILTKAWDSDGYEDAEEISESLNDQCDNSGKDNGCDYQSFFAINDYPTEMADDPLQSSWNILKRKPVSTTFKGAWSPNSHTGKTSKGASKYYSNTNKNNSSSSFLQYIEKCLDDRHKSYVLNRRPSNTNIANSRAIFYSNKDWHHKGQPSPVMRRDSKPRPRSSINFNLLLDEYSSFKGSERCQLRKNNVSFPDINDGIKPQITYSDSPARVWNRSRPYAVSIHNRPADFVCRQSMINILMSTQSRRDIQICSRSNPNSDKISGLSQSHASTKRREESANSQPTCADTLVKAFYKRAVHLDRSIIDDVDIVASIENVPSLVTDLSSTAVHISNSPKPVNKEIGSGDSTGTPPCPNRQHTISMGKAEGQFCCTNDLCCTKQTITTDTEEVESPYDSEAPENKPQTTDDGMQKVKSTFKKGSSPVTSVDCSEKTKSPCNTRVQIEDVAVNKTKKGGIDNKEQRTYSIDSVIYEQDRPFPDWDPPQNRCTLMRTGLKKLGRKRYTKTLKTMMDRSCSGKP